MRLASFVFLLFLPVAAPAQQGPPIPGQGPGPWDNDVQLYRVWPDGSGNALANFERAGVSSLIRLADGRLMAAHQWFPADDPASFDKVAVRFSGDDGVTWSGPRAIELTGLPENQRSPFDPTLLQLPDGRIRLYFTTNSARTFEEAHPWLASAISDDGVSFTVEPGVRLAVAGQNVIDCAAVLHRGVFHLFSPVPFTDGTAYHATSTDGVDFVRQADVTAPGAGSWLGAAVNEGDVVRFFGTGRGGLWTATSADAVSWSSAETFVVRGADPGVVQELDGSRLVLVTGPPRPGTPSTAR